jgi:hypothetical protein
MNCPLYISEDQLFYISNCDAFNAAAGVFQLLLSGYGGCTYVPCSVHRLRLDMAVANGIFNQLRVGSK